MKDRRRARDLAAEFIQKGDPTGWFEALYREAEEGKSTVPWADRRVSPYLASFWTAHPQQTAGKSGVVGSGPGDDAEQLGVWGFRTTAFDISETAIRVSRKRFPHSTVDYHAANLLDPLAQWRGHFDFVFEANTLQVLPTSLRPRATKNIASFLRPGGLLLVVARGRESSDPEGQMPWPSPVPKSLPSPLTVSKSSHSKLCPILTNRTSAASAPFSVFSSSASIFLQASCSLSMIDW